MKQPLLTEQMVAALIADRNAWITLAVSLADAVVAGDEGETMRLLKLAYAMSAQDERFLREEKPV